MASEVVQPYSENPQSSVSMLTKPGHNALETSGLIDRIKGVIYGNCIGDAIGLLTEFMDKEEAARHYGPQTLQVNYKATSLEYYQKIEDRHRRNWEVGDWTDDSDQMLLILQTLLDNNARFNEKDFAARLKFWAGHGYPELGDHGGCGLGRSTYQVLSQPDFLTNPHLAAQSVWEQSGCYLAPNGGVMRTSILGTMQFYDLDKVIANTTDACKVTHADPRCIASCIAVTTAIALMLQGQYINEIGDYDVEKITQEAYEHAVKVIEDPAHIKELKQYMFADDLRQLELDASAGIGYTFKCLGAGFWAFKQKDFREAITKLTMEAGDADTNCAVAGALLGCKVGFSKLPGSWVNGLRHRQWLENLIKRYLEMFGLPSASSQHQSALNKSNAIRSTVV